MLRLSVRTFADRWQLFVGAILTVCVGVALVQSALLILVSAATAPAPPWLSAAVAAQQQEALAGAITLLAMTLGFATFLAVFIVGSTFAFTVAQRRRDLALLRLIGGSRGQLRRLLLSEALLLGLIGTALGVPVGLLLMRVQTWLLHTLGLVPGWFEPVWQDWILGVSAGVGLLVALAGVLSASRRASRVRPLEALRDKENAASVMTFSRWFFGLLFLGGSITLVITAQIPYALADAVPMALMAAITGSIALSAFSPLLVPLAGRLLGLVFRGSTLGMLAQANLRTGVRRSASTAAPLLVLTGLVLGSGVTMYSTNAAAAAEQQRALRADLVVESPRGLAELPGVVSVQREMSSVATIPEPDDDGPEYDVETQPLTAVRPAAYERTHEVRVVAGELAALRGNSIAVGEGAGLTPGQRMRVRVGAQSTELTVVAVLAEGAGEAAYLVPHGFAPHAQAKTSAAVLLDPGTDVPGVAQRLRAAGSGEVLTKAEWLASQPAGGGGANPAIMLVLLGLSGLYASMAVVNAVVVAAADRKSEFAVARVSGLGRAAVVRMATYESLGVAVIGVTLGLLAAGGSALAIGMATAGITGSATVAVPWSLLCGLLALGFVLVTVTSMATALSATRARPVELLGAHE